MRILFVSYFFPPFAHATAVERTVMLLKGLKELGHEVAVLTGRDYTYMQRDYSYLRYIPRDAIIKRPFAVEPSTIFKKVPMQKESKRNLFRYFFWPDTKVLWIVNAIPAGIKLVKAFKPDLILSFAPPYTDLLVGHFLSKRFRIPHVVDLLDPWSDDLYYLYPAKWQKSLTSYFEKEIFREAKGIVVAIYPMKWRIVEKYPFIKPEKVENFTFGIKDETLNRVPPIDYSKPFTALYLGTIRGIHKNPSAFIEAFSRFVKKHPEAKLRIAGNVAEEAKEYILSLIPKDNVELLNYVENERILELVKDSHVMWLLITRGPAYELVMPAKTITYLGLGRPILATIPKTWTYDFLKNFGGVTLADPDDVEGIEKALEDLYHAYVRKNLRTPREDLVQEFLYSRIAQKYEAFLKSLV